MTQQMNATALHDLAGAVHDIANRRAGVMSTYEVANLEIAHEQLNQFAKSIERPAPTEHCLSTAQHGGHEWATRKGWPGTGYWCPGFEAAEEHPPTREQIAEVLWRNEDPARHNRDFIEADPLTRADHLESAAAVLALIQNGADRG